MKKILDKAGKQLSGIAKQAVKQVGQEVVEIPKGAGKQVIGIESTGESPIVEAMTHSNGKTKEVSPEEKKKIEAIAREGVKEMEEKMKMLREERKHGGIEKVQPKTPPKVEVTEPGQRFLPRSPQRGPKLAMPGKKGPGEKGAEILRNRR